MELTDSFILSADQIASFRDTGLLRINFNLEANLLDSIIENVAPCYDKDRLQQREPGIRVQDAWKQIDEVRQLAVNHKILAALNQLFDRKPLPFQTLNFPVGTAQRVHSDTIHFNSVPKGYMAGVWVALEDIDEENGPLIYYPGSHKMEEYSLSSLGLGLGSSRKHYPEYEEAIQRFIKANKLVPEYGLIKKGEAIIWHANLLHGGAPPNDPDRSRHSQVIHYYFEGCKYYAPLNNIFMLKRFYKPFWIPDKADFELPVNLRVPRPWYQRILRRFGLIKDP